MATLTGRTDSMNGITGRNGPSHVRQRSEIDSLSPQMRAALHSTFGGKLVELRSQYSLRRLAEEEDRKEAELREAELEAQRKQGQEKENPTSIPSPAEEANEDPLDPEKEGTYLVASYVIGIALSVIILWLAGRKVDGYEETEEGTVCVNSRCLRVYGYVIPLGLCGFNLLCAVVFSVFDISFGIYNALSTFDKVFLSDNPFSFSAVRDLALSHVLDTGFITIAVSLLWLVRTSIVDPFYTFCEEGIKLYWLLGLIIMAAIVFCCAVKSVQDPASTLSNMKGAARIVSLLFLLFSTSSLVYYVMSPLKPEGRQCQMIDIDPVNGTTEDHHLQLYKGWFYEEPVLHQLQLYSDAHQFDWCPGQPFIDQCEARYDQELCEARYDWGMCKARYDQGMCEPRNNQGMCEPRVVGQGMCEARYDQGMCEARYDQEMCEARYEQGMCEARYDQECEWPWLKRIEVYEHKEKCRYDWPQCDWPWMKQIQVYESEDNCKYQCPSCDWPLLKRMQVYAREDCCAPLELPQSDWPYLKQIQRYEAGGRCQCNDRPVCDWPLMKQLQVYEPWNECDWVRTCATAAVPVIFSTNTSNPATQ